MPNFSAELCKLLCRSFSSTPVNFGNFSAVIFAVFYSSVFQAFAKIKKKDASLCPERRVPKPEGTRPYSRRDTSFCPNPRVDFIKSSCGFCQILTRIFTSPREVLNTFCNVSWNIFSYFTFLNSYFLYLCPSKGLWYPQRRCPRLIRNKRSVMLVLHLETWEISKHSRRTWWLPCISVD